MPSVKEIYHKIDDVRIEADTINLNVDGLEALASTQQADVAAIKADLADGVTINQPVSVSGPLTDTQLRASAVPVSAASLPLPSGAATSANQTTANTSLSNIDGKLPSGLTVTSSRLQVDANSNIRDGSGNAITSTVSGSSRRLDVMLSSGGATGSAAPTNANLVGGTDGTNLRGLSVDSSGRLNINGSLFTDGSLTYTNTGAITAGSVVIASTDVTNYREASIQIVSLGSGGGGIIPQISNDNSNWVASSAQNSLGTSTASNLTSTSSIFKVSFQAARYFRIVTNGTISSGTTTIVVYLSSQATPISTQLVNVSGGVTIQPSASFGHATTHTNISASGTNATLVRSSATNVAFIHAVNTSSLARYLKLYNLGVSPTVGTSNPFFNYLIPPASALNIDFGFAGLRLTTGLAYAITGGQALLDTTSVNAGDVVINIATV